MGYKEWKKKMKKKKSRGETAAQRGKFLSAIFPNRTVINPRLLFDLTAAVLLWHTRREKQKRRAKHKRNRENKQTVFPLSLKNIIKVIEIEMGSYGITVNNAVHLSTLVFIPESGRN